MWRYRNFLIVTVIAVYGGCTGTIEENHALETSPLFSRVDPVEAGIEFVNTVTYTEEFNVYTYRNYYNGGGVGIGDVNNDGLPDLFFCGNVEDNRLYLNQGDFKFEDITSRAGVSSSNVWSTGVSMADVNGDGLLDIYVCKSGSPQGENRNNELFINNGDLTFSEQAEQWGINDFGLSTHAAFFDYDKDGDLDMYLLNNSFRSVGGYDLRPGQREIRDPEGGNKLYRNEGDRFIDVSEEAGIYGSNIGFGLGVTIGDVNRDGWQDIYVSNDFFEKDYLYINNQDGTFSESLESQIRELSLGSMGADMADINNDGFPEIFVTEMLPEREDRLKTKSQFETWDKYQMNLKNGYYRQFSRNVLQLNNGFIPGSGDRVFFSEIGRAAGVHATDWSWGALIFDMDNDGYKDLFVANGIFKDLLDQDYINYMANPITVREIRSREGEVITKLVDAMPSEPLPNYAYRNNGDLTFSNQAKAWGLDEPSFSNGSAYGDLDNDGDLDLVVNTVNMPPLLYRNNASGNANHHYLTLQLEGEAPNLSAFGAQVTVRAGGQTFYQELAPMRGFQSTVDSRLHFGLGKSAYIESITVRWPDLTHTVIKEVPADTLMIVRKLNTKSIAEMPEATPVFTSTALPGLDFTHRENEYEDFDRDHLLLHMMSNEGAPIAVADVDGDGQEDVYAGGARDQAGKLFLQMPGGQFKESPTPAFGENAASEDIDALFFDADQDGDPDLYVASGGSDFSLSSSALDDRLYLNDGTGNFTHAPHALSLRRNPSSCVKAADYDQDGDLDLFVGTRLRPYLYGVPVDGNLLENDGQGNFRDVTSQRAPGLKEAGLITDASWLDYDLDGDEDLVICGEWMGIRLYENNGQKFTEVSDINGLAGTEGFWHSIEVADLDGDGDPDLIAGNSGVNTRLKASPEQPVEMYVNDFDRNGSVEQIVLMYNGDSLYPVAMLHDLVKQMPGLRKHYLKYEDYKLKGMEDLFSHQQIERSVHVKALYNESMVFLNEEEGFILHPLPFRAQLSPLYAIHVTEVNGDGHPDLLLGGNLYRAKPEVGIYDALYGLLLTGNGDGTFRAVPGNESGIYVPGETREILPVQVRDQRYFLFSRSDMEIVSFK